MQWLREIVEKKSSQFTVHTQLLLLKSFSENHHHHHHFQLMQTCAFVQESVALCTI